MKLGKIFTTFLIFALLFSALPMGQANANGGGMVIGFEDFDGGAINLSSTSNVYDYDAGGGSLGDVFGRVSAFFGGGTGMPFDVADDTVADVSGGGVYPSDTLGLAGQNTTAFFAMNDMDAVGVNNAVWTFDISSTSSITDITIDLGALGDFEASSSDGFKIEARVDSEAYQTIFEATTDESAFKDYRPLDGGYVFSDDDPLQLFIDGSATSVGFLDKSDPTTGNFDTYTSTLLSGQSGSTLDVRVSWAGTPSGSEPMGIDNITIYGSGGGKPNEPVVVTCGDDLQTYETAGATRGVSATDADGIVVSMSIAADPIPATGSITLQNFVAATAVGETATGDVVVDADVPAGVYEVTVTAANNDATPQEGACTFNIDVVPFLTIGEVQGVVEDSDSGTSHRSPYEGENVAVQGVVYEKTQEYRSSGGAYYGIFVQNTAAEADSDPNSSDGIFAFLYIYPTLPVWGGGYYEPQIGDELVLVGQVEERFNNTRLNFVDLAKIVRSGVVIDDEIPAFDVNPPATIVDDATYDDIQDAYRYWERREGMRGQIPANSTVLNGRDVFASSFDSEIWVARPDSPIAQRIDPYERRSFRDVNPLDDIPTVGFDNDNPYRILIGTFGVKASEDDTTTLLAPARTYDTLVQPATGGVYYNFGKYSIQVDAQIQLSNGVDPSLNNPPTAPDPDIEYSVAVFNVENLYDYVDDAFDGCDFHGNAGCPGVSPPFDYVPVSNEVYQVRLQEIAMQIINNLHSPDIIMAQEAEDQDVCSIIEGEYTCPAYEDQVDNADGKPDTLQELAQAIYNLGGPMYDAALDRDGADDRGIISGYLFRTDRVQLLPAMADDPVLGDDPKVVYDYPGADPLPYNYDVQNPKVLNAVLPDFVTGSTDGDNVFTRPPQVALFRIWRDSVGTSVFQDVYLSNNHFSSGPDNRVGQRTEQAAYNAAIVNALNEVNTNVYVGVGGDLNVYPRPDDPFPTPNESDQLAALYNVPLTNLWNIMVSDDPVSAFSYVYQGQTQTLDQLFTSSTWLAELTQAKMTHINADFPADYDGDGPRGTSDHDPVFSAYSLLPTLYRLEELVMYYDANGMITGNNTTRILLDRLERARRFQEHGQYDAYMSQLQAFIDQIYDFTPQFITNEAADSLIFETTLLLSLP
jgi:predicted extracellular nuclease